MAIPPPTRATMKKAAELAAPVATALTRKRTALNSIAGRRPIKSATLPAPNAPTAHPSNTEATAKPVAADWVPKAFARASTAPLITPLSKPKRKPPIAATHESMTTYAELATAPVRTGPSAIVIPSEFSMYLGGVREGCTLGSDYSQELIPGTHER